MSKVRASAGHCSQSNVCGVYTTLDVEIDYFMTRRAYHLKHDVIDAFATLGSKGTELDAIFRNCLEADVSQQIAAVQC
jgi:hypothetical protein